MIVLLPLMLLTAPSARAATPEITSTAEQSATATPKEKAQNASEMVAEVDAAVTTGTKLLESAKAEKTKNQEMIKCLEDKLPQLKTIQEIAGRSNTAMKTHMAGGDMATADREYRQLAVLFGRAKELLAAAQQCVKSTQGESGKTASSISGGTEGTVDSIDEYIDVVIPPIDTPS